MNKLVMIQGIVNYCSISRVRLLNSTHYSKTTNKIIKKGYEDLMKVRMDQEDSN